MRRVEAVDNCGEKKDCNLQAIIWSVDQFLRLIDRHNGLKHLISDCGLNGKIKI